MRERIAEDIAQLFPGYFALVMATGIISIAAFLLEMPLIPMALFWINVPAYIILWILLIIRIIKFPAKVWADVSNHARGPGFFTLIAGTCILGTQFFVLAGNFSVAFVLWLVGIFLWLLVMYGFFTALTTTTVKPPLEVGLNGSWLLAIVSTQAISVLGTLLSAQVEEGSDILLFFTLCMYLLGGMLYLIFIPIFFYRFTFFPVNTQNLTPPYWINMGAVAITTLAGSLLILAASRWSLLQELIPFLKAFTLFFWVTATWWIPLLIIFGLWRHVYQRFPLQYDPQYWGIVFPFGMYTVCTWRLAQALELPFLFIIPRFFIFIALGAWLLTCFGFIPRLLSYLKPMRSET